MAIQVLLFLFLLTSCAARILPRDSGIVAVPLSRYTPISNSSLEKRQDGASLPQVDDEIYFIQAEIGTPQQTVYVQLDTGSNELWVYSNCDESASPSLCADFGTYDPTKSSTSTDTKEEFGITYGSGSVDGIYYIDTVSLAGVLLPTTQFGVATTSSVLFSGIMGVSFGYGYNTFYYNVIDKLYIDGKTNSKLFSLALGSATSAAGEIVFGGIDTLKYSGSLALIPILFPGPDGSYRYWVNLNSLGNTKPGAASSKVYTGTGYSLSVILDSGTTLTYIPQTLFNLVLADFPEAVQQSNGIYSVPCSYVTEPGTINFGFGNTIIHVPYSQFIWQPVTGTCYLGFLPLATGDIPILGDTFLRGAYVVYDQSQTSIYLANYVDCGSNLVAVPAGYGAASAFKGQCSSSTTATTTTTSSSTSKTSGTTSSSTSSTSSSSSHSSTTSSSRSSFTTSTTSSSKSSTSSSSSHSSTTSSSSSSLTSSTTSSSKSSTSSSPSHSSTSSSSVSTTTSHTSSSSSTSSTSKSSSSTTSSHTSSPSSTSSTSKSSSSTTSSHTSSSSSTATSKSSSSTTSTSKSSLSSTTSSSKSSSTSPFALPTQGCHADNCLRALENTLYEASAYTFCRAFLATTVPPASTTGVPTYLANCGPTSVISSISSACPCFLVTYTPSTTSTTPKPSSTSSTPSLPTQGCHQDNCLRALENPLYESSAYTFCKSFLATTVPAVSTAGIPTYLANCGPTTTVSALSSACPCFLATY